MLEEQAMITFLKKFDEHPFLVKINGHEHLIGEGAPTFTVNFKKVIPLKDLVTSTSLALGEAYMDGDLDIEGNLYQALDNLLGQMGKFSTDEHHLKSIMFPSSSKKNQKKEVSSHYDIGNDFYKLWLDETMSYSCGYFKHEDDTLYQAQKNKVDYILEKLYLKEKEDGELSDAFWNASLPQSLDTSVASSPYFHVFLASQVKANDRGFLSKDVLVGDLISLRGDIHHLFPKDYLSKNGLDRSKYNQIANYVYMQSEVNIKVGNKPPKDYFELIKTQILDDNKLVSGLSTEQELLDNLKMNCVPTEIMEMSIDDYQEFLHLRRKLMAQKIKEYYNKL